jgi:hypothetical protein
VVDFRILEMAFNFGLYPISFFLGRGGGGGPGLGEILPIKKKKKLRLFVSSVNSTKFSKFFGENFPKFQY